MDSTFIIEGWEIGAEGNSVEFRYSCSKFGAFAETVTFPADAVLDFDRFPELGALLDFTAAIIGVSYYKSAVAKVVRSSLALTPAAVEAVKALYTEGLGEFYARNELPFPPDITFELASVAPLYRVEDKALRAVSEDAPILAFGGGKDSQAAAELLTRLGIAPRYVSVVLADVVAGRLASMTDQPITFMTRRIDQKLLELNRSGTAYNGHVPITSINSILLSTVAYLTGSRWTVFANERGASVPTLIYRGHPVNHQFSKSFGFEGMFRSALGEIVGTATQYFSILRPFSELWIGAYVAKEAKASWPYFASCNRNFVFAGPNKLPDGVRWCGKCSKCVFTATILAPHLDEAGFNIIFECDVLGDKDNIDIARDLCGLGGAKPWECVGDIEDTFVAMHHLAHDAVWKDKAVPAALRAELDARSDLASSEARLNFELKSRGEGYLPDALAVIVEAD
jgi:UDP-N-acetyl-alpha-D-muramoyl-L-alanyl-L-glutamate epimerase